MITEPKHRGLRRVVLLHPFEFPLTVCLLIVAGVFLVFPDALEHSPVSFEVRGVIHHVWHTMLFLGALLTVIGLFRLGARGLVWELVGLTLLLACLAMNLTALIANELGTATASTGEHLSGIDAVLRIAAMSAIAIRIWIIATRPTVTMTVTRDA
jgi:hypothetical protein